MVSQKNKPVKTKRIYLDTAGATPLDPRVFKQMKPYFSEQFGNPSSIHQEGVVAGEAVREARAKIASLLGAQPDEIIFTGSGTESATLAIIGVARGLLQSGKISQPGHIITSAIEHAAVLEACATLEQEGWRVTVVPVLPDGIIDLVRFKEALSSETVLVSVMYANNEIGTIEPLREIAKIIRRWRGEHGKTRLPYFHTDACQAPRFLPLLVDALGVDALSFNGSKIYGPKGIGCLYLKRNTFCQAIIPGGGQEKNRRSGTENVPGIVGLATALEIATADREKETKQLSLLRDYFIKRLEKDIPDVTINGHQSERLPNNISVTFKAVFAELLLLELDYAGIACSTGSACTFNQKDESHVIIALGHDRSYADSTLRFTLDRRTTKKEIDYVLSVLSARCAKIRATPS